MKLYWFYNDVLSVYCIIYTSTRLNDWIFNFKVSFGYQIRSSLYFNDVEIKNYQYAFYSLEKQKPNQH